MCDDKPANQIDPKLFGIHILPADEFDEIVEILSNPGEPSETILRGQELLKKLKASALINREGKDDLR